MSFSEKLERRATTEWNDVHDCQWENPKPEQIYSDWDLSKPVGSHGQHPGSWEPQRSPVRRRYRGCCPTGSLESDASWGGRVVKHEATKFTTHPMILNL
jgi:hypothetical protein